MGPVKYITLVIPGPGGGTPRRTHLTKSGFRVHFFYSEVKTLVENTSCSSSALKRILRSRSPLKCHKFFAQALLWEEFKGIKNLAWEAQLAPMLKSSAPIIRVLRFPAVLAGFQGHSLGWISASVCGIHAHPPRNTSAPLLMPSNTIITQRSTASANVACRHRERKSLPARHLRLSRDSEQRQLALILWTKGRLYPFGYELDGN